MSFVKKFVLLILLCLIGGYFLIIYLTGVLAEDQLTKADTLIEGSTNQVLKDAKLSYASESSGLYQRTGTLLLNSPKLKAEVSLPVVVKLGFLKAEVQLELADLLQKMSKNGVYLPAELEPKSIEGGLTLNLYGTTLEGMLEVNARAKYKKGRHEDFKLHLTSKAERSLKPEFVLELLNLYNPAMLSVSKLNWTGNVEGLSEISSLGKGRLSAEGLTLKLKRSSLQFNKLESTYKTYDYDRHDNFKVDVTAKGQGSLGYLSQFNFTGTLLQFSLDKLLYTGNYLKEGSKDDLAVMLQDFKQLKIKSFDFTMPKRVVQRLTVVMNQPLSFSSHGNLTFAYPDYEGSLCGIMHLTTSSLNNSPLETLFKKNSQGSYSTDLEIDHGKYSLSGIKLRGDLLSDAAIYTLFKGLGVERQLIRKADELGHEINKLQQNLSLPKLFK
ncbi:MAG: hypothetical protein K6F05_04240 [Succinivibrio sp.]|nr:hypothetical protein [Succinivibrio sp.]